MQATLVEEDPRHERIKANAHERLLWTPKYLLDFSNDLDTVK